MRLAAIAAALCMAGLFSPAAADAHSRNDKNWHDRWENRRDARRVGIIAGAVAGGVARSAGNERAQDRFEECVMAYGYDYECERRRYDDEMQARRSSRRTAVLVGVTARAIVRD